MWLRSNYRHRRSHGARGCRPMEQVQSAYFQRCSEALGDVAACKGSGFPSHCPLRWAVPLPTHAAAQRPQASLMMRNSIMKRIERAKEIAQQVANRSHATQWVQQVSRAGYLCMYYQPRCILPGNCLLYTLDFLPMRSCVGPASSGRRRVLQLLSAGVTAPLIGSRRGASAMAASGAGCCVRVCACLL
jgi:hypothetical protein